MTDVTSSNGDVGPTLIPLRFQVDVDNGDNSSTHTQQRNVELQFECDWDVGIGGSVWTSGEILTSHFALRQREYRSLFQDKVVVELGSGTGFVGLMTAACFNPAQVILTDLATHVDCMEKNVKRNAATYNSDVAVRAVELAWGNEDHAHKLIESIGPNGKVDIILGTDVAYLRELYEPLLSTLTTLAHSTTRVFLGLSRTDTDTTFFRRLEEQGFEYYKVEDRYLPHDYRGKDFGIFEITRRQAFSTIVSTTQQH